MWKDKIFWFSQPSSVLNHYDNYFMWLFLGMTAIGAVLLLVSKFLVNHPVHEKVAKKFSNSLWITGLVGLLWWGFRYENIPFFSYRYWVPLIVIVFLVRVAYIFKYLFTAFRTEKASYDRMSLNSKYILSKK